MGINFFDSVVVKAIIVTIFCSYAVVLNCKSDSYYDRGVALCNNGNYKEAFIQFKQSSSPSAMLMVAGMYKEGIGVEQSNIDYYYWLNKAAETGDAAAQFCMAVYYTTGEFHVPDFKKAFYYFEKSAMQGYTDSETNLGLCYMEGKGCELDYQKAMYWTERAVRKNDGWALNNLGYIYHHGLGVEVDYEKAREYYNRAWDLGIEKAMYNLSLLEMDVFLNMEK